MTESRIVVRTERASVIKVKTPGAPGARGAVGPAAPDLRGTLLDPVDISNGGLWNSTLIVIDDLPAGTLRVDFENLQSAGDISIGVGGDTLPVENCLDPGLDNPELWTGASHPSFHTDNTVFPVGGLLSFTVQAGGWPDFAYAIGIPVDPQSISGSEVFIITVVSGPGDLSWIAGYGLNIYSGFIWLMFFSDLGGDVVLSDISLKTPYLSPADGKHNSPLVIPAYQLSNIGDITIRDFNNPDLCPYWVSNAVGSTGPGGVSGNSGNTGDWSGGQATKLFISSAAPITGGSIEIRHREVSA